MTNNKLTKGGVSICHESFVLKVTSDKLEARIIPKEEMGVDVADVDYQELCNEARDFGVVYGFLDKPVPKGDGSFCIARGTAAIKGIDAKLKTYVKPSVVRAPKNRQPGKDNVDFRELGSIVNVPKDKLLFKKIPPSSGMDGKNVLGKNILSKAGKNIKIKIGPGVTLSEDQTKVISKVEGKFIMVDGKAAVLSEHKVNGDVDMSVGNIAFVGKQLFISGTVLPGFKVKCKGSIYIGKGIENSEVTTGQSLTIKGGVIGEEVVLQSWGDVSADFIENIGRIEVRHDLKISDSMIQASVRVGGNVIALSGKGTIIGGKCVVGGSIHVRELGSDAEVVTEVSVGVKPELEVKKKKLQVEKDIWPVKMNDILKNTTALKKLQKEEGGKLPPEKNALLKKLNALLPQVMEKVNELTVKEEEFAEEMAQAMNECVYVYSTVYPGVIISIGEQTRTLIREEHGVVLHYDKAKRKIHARAMTPEERVAIA